MIRYPRKITNYNAFIDGFGYAGLATAAKMPNLKLQTERHRGAGMDGGTPIDLGQEDMQASLTLSEWRTEAIQLLGRRDARLTLRPTQKAGAEGDFDADAFICSMGGLWNGIEFADLGAGKGDVTQTVMLEADYFRMVYQGNELCEIDFRAGKRVVGGVDQLAAARAAMGI